MYHLEAGVSSVACVSSTSLRDLHCLFGHLTLQVLKKLVPELVQVSSLECESCQMGKHHRVPFLLRVSKGIDHPFEPVYSNIWGPCSISSIFGFKYFIIFMDDFSHMTWLMKNRSEALSIFQTFRNVIKNHIGMFVHTLWTNNATEVLSSSFMYFMSDIGINH